MSAPAKGPEPVELPAPWERQPTESEEAWLAFRAYRDMPPEQRILRRSAVKTVEVLSRWYRDHNWIDRCKAFDAHVDHVSIEERKRILEMASRDLAYDHAIMLADARELVSRELGKLVTVSRDTDMHGLLKPSEVIKLFDTTIKLDRLVRGQSTENIKEEVDVSKLSLDEARELARLMRKAGALSEDK